MRALAHTLSASLLIAALTACAAAPTAAPTPEHAASAETAATPATEAAEADGSGETEATARPEGWTGLTHGDEAEPNYAVVFPQATVNTLTITIDPADYAAMQADLNALLGEPGEGGGFGGGPGGGGPGASLRLLPEADLPADLGWAEPNLAVAGAFARLAVVVEQAGASALSPTVRDTVYHHIHAWTGQNPGLSRNWVEQAIRGHDEATQAAARLTLLTALASHQIDEHVVLTFRAHQAGDEALVGAVAWASFTAARRIGAWLWNPVRVRGLID